MDMKQDALEQTAEAARSHRRGRNWRRIAAGFLAAVTVFSSARVLPAAAEEQAWYCGYEEHQHGADCYEKRKLCAYEDDAQGETHVHTEQCYRKLVCTLEEGGHIHTGECVSTEETLTCDITEADHVHDETCTQTRQSYICGQEETGHVHDEGCYETVQTPQCGLAEGHVHGDTCWENILICGKEEHIHTLQCESDPEADVETEQMWAQAVEKQTLSGNWREDVLTVAQGELGYEESKRNFRVGPDGITVKGYTRYGAWYADPYGDWSGMFVSFCLHYAGIPETEMPYGADCAQWVEKLAEKSLFFGKERAPQKGDLIFFDTDGDGSSDRVGLIVDPEWTLEGNRVIRTLEGDSNGRVEYANHAPEESGILGYAAVPENPALTQTADATDPSETTAATDPAETKAAMEKTMLAANGAEDGVMALSDLTLEVGKQLDVVYNGVVVKIPFTPSISHEYVLESKDTRDTLGYLYDANGKEITRDDDSGSGNNFKITYTLTAGTTYYWGVKYYGSSSSSGTIPVLLSFGTHTYAENESGDMVCICGTEAPKSGTDWTYENGVLTIHGDGAMANYISADQAPWFPHRNAIQKVVVEEGVTKVSGYAFNGYANLTEVSLPNSLTSIGANAFCGCSGLTGVTIPEGVTSMGSYAFAGCSGLSSVTIPAGISQLAESAFYACSNLTEVSLPDGLTSIGAAAFRETGLTSIAIPGTVTSIGNQAFYDCEGLTGITLPDGLTSLGQYAFYLCSGLTGNIVIPEGVTEIQRYTFYGCENLTSITLPDGITSIGTNAFINCTGLTSFRIPGKTTRIESGAFGGCSKINTLYWDAEGAVQLGASNTGDAQIKVIVGKQAGSFTNSNLQSLIDMGCCAVEFERPNYIDLTALQGPSVTPPLTHLQDAQHYIDEKGVFYRIDGDEAYVAFCPAGLDSYTIPATIPGEDGTPLAVVGVGVYAFNQATVRTLEFKAPENIKTLEDFSFYHAVDLESINGANTQETVLETFTSLESQGLLPFQYTKIQAEDAYTMDPVVIPAEEGDGLVVTMQTNPGKDRTPDRDEASKTFLYYTGNQAGTVVSISNPADSTASENTVVRVYYHFDADNGSLNYKPGQEYELRTEYNTYKLKVYKTNLRNCYCLEMKRPVSGDTVSIVLNSTYPSPKSGGGTASVWCSVLTEEEQKTCGPTDLAPITKGHLLRWDTVKDRFPIQKKMSGTPTMLGDGKGGAVVSGLEYKISIPREGNTLQGMGKDYMTSVEYRDVLTLGEGVSLSDAVVQAIQNRNYTAKSSYNGCKFYINTPEQTCILTLSAANSYNFYNNCLKKESLAIEDGKLVVRWEFCNTDLSTEIPDVPFKLAFSQDVVVVSSPQPDTTYTVTNDVYDTQHFMHSGDVEDHADCPVEFHTTAGSLEVEKRYMDVPWGIHYMGQTAPFQITAKNPGALPYNDLATIEDQMDVGYYLTTEQMVSLFEDPQTSQIKITGATLCNPAAAGKDVTAMDGTTHGATSLQNTGTDTAYIGMESSDNKYGCQEKTNVVITVTRAAGGLQLQFTHGGTTETETCGATAAGIQEVLDRHGFLVTYSAEYSIVWTNTDASGNPIPLAGGQAIVKEFTANGKDTFMLLSGDRKYAFTDYSGRRRFNKVDAYDQQNKRIGWDQDETSFYSEISLTKDYTKGGQAVDDDTELNEGDVLDYTVNVKHEGEGHFDLLPLVDHMAGGQALLVPKAPNQNEAWAGAATPVSVNGAEYYRLDKEGVYSRVWTTAGQMADTVMVTKNQTGLDTLIKWYFTDYGGNRTDAVTYQSMLCPSVAVPGQASYLLSNETWLNDHQSHRLYNTVPGRYAMLLDFDKKIVKNVGDTGPGSTYCPVARGQTVTYRLTLKGRIIEDQQTKPMTLTGADLYDALPPSIGSYWEKGTNVDLAYGAGCTVKNGDTWDIAKAKIDRPDQQYIRWAEDFEITFTDEAYIYVTLTFPDDTETEKQWEAYAHKYSDAPFDNTFHVFQNQRSVSHSLAIEGKVRLQKGVYSSMALGASRMNGQENARYYYHNKGFREYVVTYYISLYNGGETRLYLTDIQDRLPKGFTLKAVGGGYGTGGARVYKADGKEARYRSFVCTSSVVKTENGTQWINFHFTKSNYSDSIRYDEARSMYYLSPGEGFAFTYECYTNNAEDTEDMALNVVTMPYYDYTNSRVKVDKDSKSVVRTSFVGDEIYAPNDGGCELRDTKWANDNGFTGTEKDWLISEVTVTRGEIKPGITKELTSRTDIDGNVQKGSNSANPTDTLNWTIKADNDGDGRMVDYTLTDEMQAPYGFIGEVRYKTSTMGFRDNGQYYTDFDQSLFTIERTNDPNTLNIQYSKVQDSSSQTAKKTTVPLTIGADPMEMRVYDRSTGGTVIYLSISKNAKGNYVMSVRITGIRAAIPAGGRGELTLSTVNYENTAENKQFLNQCFITPMAQTWEGGTNKGNVVNLETPFENKAMKTVRNSSPVTTTFGYVTESLKCIWEIGNADNNAASNIDRNYIVLENRDKLFRYSAIICNDTPEPMTQLILIDSLPERNDHGVFNEDDFRDSRFKVSLAQDPDFAVIVTESGNPGNTRTLGADAYTLEYSKATSFGAKDWDGTSQWSNDPTGARSIRLKIEDDTKTVIPAGYEVELRFTCKVDGSAEPGTIAWNSFGYHYRLNAMPPLEAAPLKVGVKIPTVPKLSKRIVDNQGVEIPTARDESFSFLLYEGEALTGSYEMPDGLISALEQAGRKYQDFTLTVPKGKSVCEAIPMTEGNGLTWVNGRKYTIVELPTGEEYAFRAFTGAASTFTYNNDQELTIVGENTGLRWSISLTKTDPDDVPLKGAVFGLYAPEETDFEIPLDHRKYNAAQQLQLDGETWYLAGIGTTNREGKLNFDDLLAERYYLLEIYAPEGYVLSKEGRLLERTDESQGVCQVTVVNAIDYELPESGGPGTWSYTAAGALLIAAAGLLLLRKKRGLWPEREERSR